MTLVEKNYMGYDFYIQAGCGDKQTIYNIVPTGSIAPTSGYYNRQYIEILKGVKFPNRYQPTLHGMSELYPHTMEPGSK